MGGAGGKIAAFSIFFLHFLFCSLHLMARWNKNAMSMASLRRVLGNFGFTFIDARAPGLLRSFLRKTPDDKDEDGAGEEIIGWWQCPVEVVNVFLCPTPGRGLCFVCFWVLWTVDCPYSYILLCKSLTLCVQRRVPVTTQRTIAIGGCCWPFGVKAVYKTKDLGNELDTKLPLKAIIALAAYASQHL